MLSKYNMSFHLVGDNTNKGKSKYIMSFYLVGDNTNKGRDTNKGRKAIANYTWPPYLRAIASYLAMTKINKISARYV